MGKFGVLIREAPGPSSGACWVDYPDGEVLFIGDAVTKNEPPFLSDGDIEAWINSLDRLLSKEFKSYRMISGRGGEVSEKDIRVTRRFLVDVEERLARLAKKKAAYAEAGKLAKKLLEKYKYPAKYAKQFGQRLRHGLQSYYLAKYFPSMKSPY